VSMTNQPDNVDEELVKNGVSARKITQWKIGGVRAFPRSIPTINHYVQLYKQRPTHQKEEERE
jgi:hypothetical protein